MLLLTLGLLESGRVKSKRAAILRDCPHHMIRCAVTDIRLDLDRDTYVGSHQANQMLQHFVGDLANVSVEARGVKLLGAMEAPQCV